MIYYVHTLNGKLIFKGRSEKELERVIERETYNRKVTVASLGKPNILQLTRKRWLAL